MDSCECGFVCCTFKLNRSSLRSFVSPLLHAFLTRPLPRLIALMYPTPAPYAFLPKAKSRKHE